MRLENSANVPEVVSNDSVIASDNDALVYNNREDAQSDHTAPLPADNQRSHFSPLNLLVNGVIFIFALFVSFNYAVLALMRGKGDILWSMMYGVSSFTANLPQYIFIPKKFLKLLENLKGYGPTYAPYLLSMALGIYFGYETFMSTIVMSRDSGDELANFFNFTASEKYLDGMEGSFSSAMALARFVSTTTLVFMAYKKMAMPYCEPWRAFLLQVHDALKKHPQACPKDAIIDDQWLFDFFIKLKESHQAEENNKALCAHPVRAAGTATLMVGCVFLIDLFKTLISRSTGSDKASTLVPAIIPNEGFYQWFCVLFFESVQSIFERNSRGVAVAKMIPLLVLAYFSGGSYGTEAEKVDKDNAIFSGVLNVIDKTVSYAVYAQIYAGIIANGGAIFATLKMYADEIKRLSPLELSYFQAVMEVTFGIFDKAADLPDEIKHFEHCLKQLQYGHHAVADFDRAMQWQADIRGGKEISFDEGQPQEVEVAVQTSNQDIYGTMTATIRGALNDDTQQTDVNDARANNRPLTKRSSLTDFFKRGLSRLGSKAASTGALPQTAQLQEALLENSI